MSKASTYQRRARDFAQRENWDAALAELRQAIAADAANPMLHNQMGDLFVRKEEAQHACEHFEKAIDLYSELGLHANAVALCRKVIRLCPSRLEVRFRLARLRHDQGLQSEATASCIDFLEHLPARSDDDVRNLEQRCRDILEQFPQAAPIGKILEKLEEARSFACAFEIVQRLAQRAADAGDDEAARRYTKKMRSLRVLVEGRGGDLPPEPARPEDLPRAVAAAAQHAPASSASKTVPAPAGPARSLEIEDIRGTIARAFAAPAASAAPHPVPGADAAEITAVPPAPAAAHAAPEAAAAPLDLEASEAAVTGPGASRVAARAAAPPPTPKEDAPLLANEYEIPETSLAEIANLFETQNEAAVGPEGVHDLEPVALMPSSDALPALAGPTSVTSPEASAPDVAAPSEPTSPQPTVAASAWSPELTEAQDEFPARDGFPAPDERPVQSEIEPPTWKPWVAPSPPAALRLRAAADPWPKTPEPAPTPSVSAVSERPPAPELGAPVWVPDEKCGALDGTQPQEGGSTHELAEVIDTFRRQMALALGDDAVARYDLGVAYFEMGLYDEAMAEFEVARASVALRERSLEMMASCMAMQGRHAEILELLAPALESQSDPKLGLGLRFSMGVACEALGRPLQARHHFEAVARVDSSYRDVRARLQRC